jgi:hypothetical protein
LLAECGYNVRRDRKLLQGAGDHFSADRLNLFGREMLLLHEHSSDRANLVPNHGQRTSFNLKAVRMLPERKSFGTKRFRVPKDLTSQV